MSIRTRANFQAMVDSHPSLRRGRVWCWLRLCGKHQDVDMAHCLQHGWPKCCGHFMTPDAPDEQKSEIYPRVYS
jgi:hypothetical protein